MPPARLLRDARDIGLAPRPNEARLVLHEAYPPVALITSALVLVFDARQRLLMMQA